MRKRREEKRRKVGRKEGCKDTSVKLQEGQLVLVHHEKL